MQSEGEFIKPFHYLLNLESCGIFPSAEDTLNDGVFKHTQHANHYRRRFFLSEGRDKRSREKTREMYTEIYRGMDTRSQRQVHHLWVDG